MQTQSERPILVVGAGITGLSAAWQLLQAGLSVVVHEAGPEPGGLLEPIRFRGIPCDRGSHRIHPAAHPLLQTITADAGWRERPRKGRLVLGGRQMRYPLQVGDFLRGLGPKTATHMGLNFLTRPGARAGFSRWEQDRKEASHDIGFQDFVTQRVGRRAYAQFYAPYVEKVWGLPPDEISQTVAKSRISTASPLTTLKKAIRPSAPTDGIFLYPAGGMTALINHLLTGLALEDVPIHFESPMGRSEVTQWDGPVFYSGHLSELVPDQGLEHRGLYIIHIALPKNSVGDTDTFYLPEADFWFGRVSQPERFSTDLHDDDTDILCIEIPEGRWGKSHNFLACLDTIESQLVTAGIIRQGTRIVDSMQTFLPRVYPMYRRGWLDNWDAAMREVANMGEVYPIGRQGLFLHCNIDQCVHIADEAVQHRVKNGTAKDWCSSVDRFLELRVRD